MQPIPGYRAWRHAAFDRSASHEPSRVASGVYLSPQFRRPWPRSQPLFWDPASAARRAEAIRPGGFRAAYISANTGSPDPVSRCGYRLSSGVSGSGIISLAINTAHGARMSQSSEPARHPEPAALIEARDALERILDRLDEIGLFQAGAHVAMAIDSVERRLLQAPPLRVEKERPVLQSLPGRPSGATAADSSSSRFE